jgi:cardiolipin synthase A/B
MHPKLVHPKTDSEGCGLWLCLGLYAAQVILLCTVALRDVKLPMRSLAWIVIGLCIPFLGFAVYYILNGPLPERPEPRRQGSRSDVNANSLPAHTTSAATIHRVVQSITHVPAVEARIRLFHDGNSTYAALLQALSSARHTIDLEFYIFRDDHIGRRIMQLLCQRAKEGVKIRFLRDGMGSRKLPPSTVTRMQSHGIECRTFFPVRFPWLTRRLNHRDHGKIVVIDTHIGFVGGINVGDEYTGRKPGVGPWRDTHVQLLGDRAIQALQSIFDMNWAIATPDRGQLNRVPPRTRGVVKTRQPVPNYAGEWAEELTAWPAHGADWTQGFVQAIESGPDRRMQSIRNLFFTGLTQANASVDITTPYFVPDTDVLTAIKTAVLKGVVVRLLVPEQPDHKAVGLASRTFYKELLDVGVQIYLYTGGILHAKVMTIDDDVSILGAANYDLRSFRTNYEVCQVVYCPDVASELRRQFEQDLQHSFPLTTEWLQKPPPWHQGAQRIARLFAPLL